MPNLSTLTGVLAVSMATCGHGAMSRPLCPSRVDLTGHSRWPFSTKRVRERLFLSTSVQPLHVILHAGFERKLWRITECIAHTRQVRFGEVLIMRVRIIDVIRLKICA